MRSTVFRGPLASFVATLVIAQFIVVATPARAEHGDLFAQCEDPVPVKWGYRKNDPPPDAQLVKQECQVQVEEDVTLYVDISRLEDGDRHPALLRLTPYGGGAGETWWSEMYGWTYVVAHVRGTGRSSGIECLFCEEEQQDGKKLVEWVGETWSDGNVALWGTSYAGISGLLVAAQQPEYLKAVVARNAFSDPYREAAYHNGMLSQFFLAQWSGYQTFTSTQSAAADPDTERMAARLLERRDNLNVLLDALVRHPYYDDEWIERSVYEKHSDIDVPVMLIDGWFDGFSRGAVWNLQGIEGARLLMTPFGHHFEGRLRQCTPKPPSPVPPEARQCGGYDFEPSKEYDKVDATYTNAGDRTTPGWAHVADAFLGPHLGAGRIEPASSGTGVCDPAETWRICYFDLGARTIDEAWHKDQSWPPSASSVQELYLSGARSGSSSSLNDGTLAASVPEGSAAQADVFPYHPGSGTTETFSKWGEVGITPQVYFDQQHEEATGLTYTTEVLDEPLRLAGPMELNFWAETTAPDMDWVVKVSNVAPDGTSTLMTTGYLKASHRKWDENKSRPAAPWITNTEEDAMFPLTGAVGSNILEYRIDVWDTAWTVPEGHRLRVALRSSDSPNHTANPFGGVNTIFHDEKHPSRLIITTIPYGAPEVRLDVTPDQITGNGPVGISARVSDAEGLSDISSIELILSDEHERILGEWSLPDFIADGETTLSFSQDDVKLSGPSPWTVALTATDTDGASASDTATVIRIEDGDNQEGDDEDDEDEADASEETSTAPTMTGGRGSLVRTPI